MDGLHVGSALLGQTGQQSAVLEEVQELIASDGLQGRRRLANVGDECAPSTTPPHHTKLTPFLPGSGARFASSSMANFCAQSSTWWLTCNGAIRMVRCDFYQSSLVKISKEFTHDVDGLGDLLSEPSDGVLTGVFGRLLHLLFLQIRGVWCATVRFPKRRLMQIVPSFPPSSPQRQPLGRAQPQPQPSPLRPWAAQWWARRALPPPPSARKSMIVVYCR